ncbi:MAG: hypothetical protein KC636_10940 [Myxococcales bacterium]|nr:hypothetical protein [Myxococcales bacterium]
MDAVRDALAQMFPAAAARRLLSATLEGDRDSLRKLDLEVDAPAPEVAQASSQAAVHAISAAARGAPAGEEAAPAPVPTVSAAEACQALEDIFREIEDARAELSLMAPKLQKRLMVAWICRTRSFDEQFVGEPRVTSGVRRVARLLTDLSKTLWPGSVRALQMNALPECALAEIDPGSPVVLRTWTDASHLVDETRANGPDIDPGFDHYGWADHANIGAASKHPDLLLHDAQVAVERVAGSVIAFPPHHRNTGTDDISQETIVALAVHVQRLRWIRTSTLEPELWGATMGRLRWLASRLGQRAAPLRKFLDPEYVPSDTWHRLLGHADNGKKTEATAGQLPLEALAAQVREQTRGKRTLVVSETEDAAQEEALAQLLGVSVTWCTPDAAQLKALDEALSKHAYEFAVFATRFQGRHLDADLARTARTKGIPYVRVYHVEPRAFVHGFARRLGLKAGLPQDRAAS